ncbi:MAG TPA: PSD1 and planctomycete cytochrome C domain-containing protein, partial [Fimbriiglobus sp.]|nr:PSD1 and planctomycete cytochrome C domain-containing protein [Fimbriiglobus sp.]
MRLVLARLLPAVVLLIAVAVSPAADPPTFSAAQVAFYETQVKPVLKANCLKCHGDDRKKLRGGLDLTRRAGVLTGGDTGPAVDLKRPDASLLLKAISYKDEDYQMPPAGKLPAEPIAVLTKWVKDGLPWTPDGGATQEQKHAGEPNKNYWAYQPVQRPTMPEVRDKGWVTTPIDAFILAKLEAKGLKPVAPADKAALCRRAYYDLTGLPPTPEQVDEFVRDKSPDAYEHLIDKLLASPHYGEKWGRHWLDVVRFAESNGYERDGPKPFAWRYRDYVIRSFNEDKPYDRFIREQIAGDELWPDDPDAVIATGFYRLGLWDDEPADPELALYDGYDDLVTTTGQGFLAMSLNCCRCHDHKGDFFPQADYYKMVAFFRDVRPFSDTRDVRSKFNLTDITPPERRKLYEADLKQREARIDELTTKLTAIENEAIKTMSAEDQRAAEGIDRPQVVAKVPTVLEDERKREYLRLKRERDGLKKKPLPSQEFALSVNHCSVAPPKTHVLIRGNPGATGAEVAPGFPSVFGVPDPAIPAPDPDAKSSGRRTALANWLASKDNPLTARVMVNRVWQYHFGRGIVPTPSDFGKFGEMPTHPALLDWLAAEFMDPSKPTDGRPWASPGAPWALKRLHKLIMLSSTYRLSSTADAASLKADPANALHWRFDMRRLTAEEVRDSMLAVSGNLNLKAGGPSVYPKLSAEVLAGISYPNKKEHWPDSPPAEANRRSVYVFVKRSLRVPILSSHDQADTDSPCPVRYTTTVPTQAL